MSKSLGGIYNPANFATPLHLGTSFLVMTTVGRVPLASQHDAQHGQECILPARGMAVSTTQEVVDMPLTMTGLVLPNADLAKKLVLLAGRTVDPGYQGKLALHLMNVSEKQINLRAGTPIATLIQTEPDTFRVPPIWTVLDPSVRPIKTSATDEQSTTKDRIASLYARLALEGSPKNGKLLEQFVKASIDQASGLALLKSNARLHAEEIDLIVKNTIQTSFWRFAGSPILLECKNWSQKVGAPDIGVLVEKMASISPDVKFGILVTRNGVTGTAYRDAVLKQREYRQRGKYVVVLTLLDLKAIANGDCITNVIERKYDELLLI